MNDFIKRYILEILLVFLIALTVVIRSLKNKEDEEDKERPLYLKILDILGSVCIGCSVGIAIFVGTLYFTGSENSYLGFLVGYLLGSLGEKVLNILDLKFGDILTESIQILFKRLGGGK